MSSGSSKWSQLEQQQLILRDSAAHPAASDRGVSPNQREGATLAGEGNCSDLGAVGTRVVLSIASATELDILM